MKIKNKNENSEKITSVRNFRVFVFIFEGGFQASIYKNFMRPKISKCTG